MKQSVTDHNQLVRQLRRFRIPVGTEKKMQDAIAEVLRDSYSSVGREWKLSDRDRIDFFIPSVGIGIECKIDGGQTEVLDQLLRYAESDAVTSLILVTRRHNHRFGVKFLNHKPLSVIWVSDEL